MQPPPSLLPFILMPLLGCAAKGTRPHDMAATAHESEAEAAEAAAAEQAAQYDASAAETIQRCGGGGKGGRVCWTATTNPTEAHLKEATALMQVAAEHRVASEALRAAEDTACAGISPEDRDISPFFYTDDIATVAPLTVHRGGKTPNSETVGAVVTVRAVPGLTSEWLQRIVDCHIARSAALGHDVPTMPDCPLVPKGASATVHSTGTGFTVEIRSSENEAASDILARARRLVP